MHADALHHARGEEVQDRDVVEVAGQHGDEPPRQELAEEDRVEPAGVIRHDQHRAGAREAPQPRPAAADAVDRPEEHGESQLVGVTQEHPPGDGGAGHRQRRQEPKRPGVA